LLYSIVCEKTAEDLKITAMDRYLEIVYGLSNDTKMNPQLHPLPLILVRKRENEVKIGFMTFK